jgi:hypothetical protein
MVHYLQTGLALVMTDELNTQLDPGWLSELGISITKQLIQAYYQYGVGSRPA